MYIGGAPLSMQLIYMSRWAHLMLMSCFLGLLVWWCSRSLGKGHHHSPPRSNSVTASAPQHCRACRGRGWKTVRPRRLVVVRSSTTRKPLTRVVSCSACRGKGVLR